MLGRPGPHKTKVASSSQVGSEILSSRGEGSKGSGPKAGRYHAVGEGGKDLMKGIW